MKNKRALLFRLAAVLLLIAIAAVMMIVGRGHTVYFDNKALEYEGKTYEVPYKVDVTVKGEKVAKLYAEERGMATSIGQSFKMTLAVTQEKGGKAVTTTHALKLPYSMDGIVVNLPGYLAGLPEDAWLSEFVPLVVEETVEDVVVDEFGMSDMGDAPAE